VSDGPLRSPASPGEVFRVFNRMAMQGFGGVMAVAQRELCERARWLSPEQFVEMLSLSQVLPGPNIVNLALMIGDRFFGARGIVAAISGVMLVPLILVLVLATVYGQLATMPVVAGALRGMGAVAAGLVLSTALKLAPTLKKNPLGWPTAAAFTALTLLTIGFLRWPLVVVVLGGGALSMAMAWWRLARAAAR